eukprot:jgi/Psemu1/322103/estExt_fgenesh1_pg.C_190051
MIKNDDAAEGGTTAPKRKRKRKKKVQIVDDADVAVVDNADDDVASTTLAAEPVPVTPPTLELKTRDDTPVQLEVKNIVASTAEPEPSTIANVSNFLLSITRSKDDAPSSSSSAMSASSSPTSNSSSSASKTGLDDFGGKSLDDSLDQLLEDARVMTEKEKDENGMLSDEEGTDVKKVIGNALSTIVTADFFLVCGLLAWFLLGIFCSYILKDDTVQIAFNNNFETLVQPALGVLMIAAVGGSFFKEKEEEYDL